MVWGVVVEVGGVDGRSIWGIVTGSEIPKIRERKRTFSKLETI
jgi:hypothetical protein